MDVLARHNVVITGRPGGPVLLFAHGFGCDQHMWRSVAPAFEADHRVVRYDLAGSGRSDTSAYDPERYGALWGHAEDVLAICAALDLPDVVFVGHSVSAMIGVLAAAEQPERFAKLVLVAPSPSFIDDGDYVGGFSRADVEGLLDSLDSNYLGWSAAIAPVIAGPDHPEAGEELANSFCRTDPEIARHFARVTFLSDHRADLARVRTPALVLQCSDDALAPESVGRYVHERLPGSRLVVMAATGHCPNLSAPAETVAAIKAFLWSDRPAGDGPQLPQVPEDSAEDLYENAPCGYLSMLPGGLIVKVNGTFLRWTGYTREELVGRRRFQDLLTAGGRIFHETHYAPLLHLQESVREIAVDLVRADGSQLPALVNSVLRPAGPDAPALVRTTVFDATDRREYERELVRARRAAEESEARARLLARTLQESLIPPALPSVPGLDLAAVYRPAGRGDEVGGDFYDVFEIGRGNWAVVIGDVLGKGAGAAVVTALARYTIRAATMRTRRPKVGLAQVNAALRRQQPDHFCSMLCVRVHPGGSGGRTRLVVASGGHPLPLRVTADGSVGVLGRPGTLLGILDSPRLYGPAADLAAGDVVLLYTDGVTEARRDGDFFGEERLSALLAEHRDADAAAIADRVAEEVLAFQGGFPRDDIALVVLKVPDPPRTAAS